MGCVDNKLNEPKEFSFNNTELPIAFLQWKGTDACFDFNCVCGAHWHFDGYFAYKVQCSACKKVWEMPYNLFPRETELDDNTIVLSGDDKMENE